MSTSHYVNATAVRIAALVLNALGTFFLFPFILNSIGEHDFGIWSIAASITGYMLLIDFGVSLACTRFLSLSIGDEKQWQRIVTNAVALSLVLMLMFVVSGLGLLTLRYFYIDIISDRTLSLVVGVLAIETGISMVLRIYQSILRTDLKYLQLGLFEIARVLLRLIGFPLILVMDGGLIQLIMYSAVVNMLFFSCSYLYVRHHHQQTFFNKKWIDFSVIKELFHFGKFAIIVQAAELFRYRLDGVFIGIALGIASIAQYAILITAVDMAVQVLSRFLSYWETIIIRNTDSDDKEASLNFLFKSMTIGFWITALFIGNFYLLGEWFLSIWVGDKYAHLVDELILLSSLLILVTFQMSISPYLNGHGRQKTDAFMTLIEVVSKAALAVPAIHLLGFKGLMLTTLISGLLVSILGRLAVVASVSDQSYLSIITRLLKSIAPIVRAVLILLIMVKIIRAFNIDNTASTFIILGLQACVIVYIARSKILNKKQEQPVSDYS